MIADSPRLLQAAEVYADLFAGQRTAYSFWNGEHWQTAYDRHDGTQTQRPLTAEVVVNAFRSSVPISAYLLGPDNQTHLACLDIDRDDGYELGAQIGRFIRDAGGEAYLERSRRGCHLWIILTEARPAILVRRGLTALVKESLRELRVCPGAGTTSVPNVAGRASCRVCRASQRGPTVAPHRDPRIEFRPASDRLPEQRPDEQPKLGHCIRMPTMPHQKTGKRYPMVSVTTGEKLPGTLAEMVLEIETCPVGLMEELAERAPLPKLAPAPKDLRYPHGEPPVEENASDILRELWGVQNAQPGRAVKCPAHDDHRPSLSIARDDQRVWCHAPGCELSNDGHGRGTRELRAMAPQTRT